jgi:hypothetical protein
VQKVGHEISAAGTRAAECLKHHAAHAGQVAGVGRPKHAEIVVRLAHVFLTSLVAILPVAREPVLDLAVDKWPC